MFGFYAQCIVLQTLWIQASFSLCNSTCALGTEIDAAAQRQVEKAATCVRIHIRRASSYLVKENMNNAKTPYLELQPFDAKTGELNVVVETPKGSRNKFGYDEELGLFKLTGVLPAGASFPFDFGFLPSTLGGDGDPLDVLLLMDESVFTGCLVPSRLIGVIEAKQTERNGASMRNDRLIAVAAKSSAHQRLRTLTKLDANVLEEIEHFFVSYNSFNGKKFKPLGRFGPQRAQRLVKEGAARFSA